MTWRPQGLEDEAAHSNSLVSIDVDNISVKSVRDWLRSKANSIEGGTSEVQLNVIAKRILELPGA